MTSGLIVRGERPDLIMDAQGQPTPSSATVKRLKDVDVRIDMRFFPAIPKGGCWAFTERWKENDPRRIMIQNGETPVGFDFDIIGWAPLDMGSEDALDYLLKALKKAPETKEEVNYYRSRIAAFNKGVQKEALAPVTEYARELIETNAGSLFRNEGKTITKVYQTLPKNTPKRKGESLL